MNKLISIIIPVHNEEENVPLFFAAVTKVLGEINDYDFELIFVNDGSTDNTLNELNKIEQISTRIQIIDFSRNFGKEAATSAGLNECRGEAAIMIDADLQHPVEKIPEFLAKWETGVEVVVGVREKNKGEGLTKRIGSFFFYKIINSISETEVIAGATDFRLLDRTVVDEFKNLKERNRMTRALVDWMGFRREYIAFYANERSHGKASYSFWKLVRLAFNSMVSLSLFPLKLAGYLGIVITLLSGVLGLYIFLTEYVFHTNYFTAPAILAVIIVFLMGIVLICLGFIALYIASIHSEVAGRPMYIIRKSKVKSP
ncbi:glycosyltransferase [Patescibacteria group bacterium]|nr:MAG: glycosyltransferase [Patescibacteria group bacterium]